MHLHWSSFKHGNEISIKIMLKYCYNYLKRWEQEKCSSIFALSHLPLHWDHGFHVHLAVDQQDWGVLSLFKEILRLILSSEEHSSP